MPKRPTDEEKPSIPKMQEWRAGVDKQTAELAEEMAKPLVVVDGKIVQGVLWIGKGGVTWGRRYTI